MNFFLTRIKYILQNAIFFTEEEKNYLLLFLEYFELKKKILLGFGEYKDYCKVFNFCQGQNSFFLCHITHPFIIKGYSPICKAIISYKNRPPLKNNFSITKYYFIFFILIFFLIIPFFLTVYHIFFSSGIFIIVTPFLYLIILFFKHLFLDSLLNKQEEIYLNFEKIPPFIRNFILNYIQLELKLVQEKNFLWGIIVYIQSIIFFSIIFFMFILILPLAITVYWLNLFLADALYTDYKKWIKGLFFINNCFYFLNNYKTNKKKKNSLIIKKKTYLIVFKK